MFQINLNTESAAVLLRCLNYGGNAISQREVENGIGDAITKNIENLRAQICARMSEEILNQLSNEPPC